jgi:hypothetical protein
MKIMNIWRIVLMMPSLLMGSIVETPRLNEICNYLDQLPNDNALVVCDIDNTLIKSLYCLGSVAWGEHLINQFMEKGIEARKANEIESILWQTVQPRVTVQTIDPDTSRVILDIQKRKIPIIALTARFPHECDYTLAQLRSVGIDFSKQKHLTLSKEILSIPSDSMYQDGMVFATTKNKKSDVLFAFLDKTSLHPECVIFVDDKQHHVEDVERACQKRGIKCIGIRFNGADKDVKNFNPAIAELQWKAFPLMLSDEDALKMILNERKEIY